MGGVGGVGDSSAAAAAAAVSSERVYVYRHNTGRGKSEGPWRGRAEHSYDAKRHVMRVRTNPSVVLRVFPGKTLSKRPLNYRTIGIGSIYRTETRNSGRFFFSGSPIYW